MPIDATKGTVYAHEYMQYMHISLCPCLDCDLQVDLHTYTSYYAAGSIQAEMMDAAFLSISGHTWYLTEEPVAWALWDTKLPDGCYFTRYTRALHGSGLSGTLTHTLSIQE